MPLPATQEAEQTPDPIQEAGQHTNQVFDVGQTIILSAGSGTLTPFDEKQLCNELRRLKPLRIIVRQDCTQIWLRALSQKYWLLQGILMGANLLNAVTMSCR